MKAKAVQIWLEARGAELQAHVQGGVARARIMASTSQTDWAESPDLDEAVRLAMLQFDIGRA